MPLPHDDPKTREPDVGLARQTIGWEAKVPRRIGLKKTIEYFQELDRSGNL